MDKRLLEKEKKELDSFRPLDPHLVKNLEDWFRVELTYTSNASEGNTLTRQETALVVEKGLTVGGKSLVEHLEATNHAAALDWVKSIVKEPGPVTEKDILKIHGMILKGIQDDNAGSYRSVPVRVSGPTVVFPNQIKVPEMMSGLGKWLENKERLDVIDLGY